MHACAAPRRPELEQPARHLEEGQREVRHPHWAASDCHGRSDHPGEPAGPGVATPGRLLWVVRLVWGQGDEQGDERASVQDDHAPRYQFPSPARNHLQDCGGRAVQAEVGGGDQADATQLVLSHHQHGGAADPRQGQSEGDLHSHRRSLRESSQIRVEGAPAPVARFLHRVSEHERFLRHSVPDELGHPVKLHRLHGHALDETPEDAAPQNLRGERSRARPLP
mmetsp:Transcript_27629/g.72816  ORF Transcript_27629/g.72816 Transcript_27629/m.72816 type:complete len:223 (-) Transcript_27629:1127-1795(-)